ncbi:MAG: hypothetical protein WC073_08205 [Sterolibacterium sp.]
MIQEINILSGGHGEPGGIAPPQARRKATRRGREAQAPSRGDKK